MRLLAPAADTSRIPKQVVEYSGTGAPVRLARPIRDPMRMGCARAKFFAGWISKSGATVSGVVDRSE